MNYKKHTLDILKLLERENFSKLTDRLKAVTFNNLFARAVVENLPRQKEPL